MEESRNVIRVANPRKNANFFSKVSLLYLLPTFLKGFKRNLGEHDLFEVLEEHKSSVLGDNFQKFWLQELERAQQKNVTPSLVRVCWREIKWDFLLCGLFIFVMETAKMCQPLATGQLLVYFSPNSVMPKSEAYMYAAIITFCSLLQVLFSNPYRLNAQHCGMKLRVGCTSLIYRKILKLNKAAFIDTSIGKIINIVSNDSSRFDKCLLSFHFIWVNILQCFFGMYFIIREIGLAANVGIAFLLIMIIIQITLARISINIRTKIVVETDKRLKLMSEIISGIQVIKMYTWEKPFVRLINTLRKKELKVVHNINIIKLLMSGFVMYISRACVTLTIITFALLQNHLTPSKVYVVTLFYNVFRYTFSIAFAQGLTEITDVKVSINRILDILIKDEQPLFNCVNKSQTIGINLEHVVAKWDCKSPKNTLNNLSLSIESPGLYAIIGTIGAGKSSLFETILQELPVLSGKLKVNGKVSYASQQPWIFSSTVRQNILFSQDFNKERYWKVVQVCTLAPDIESLPNKDLSNIGEKGINLSGGQKARINLARAIYRDADIYLLDDPLSAVDPQVGKQLFDDCISRFLKDKIVLLSTHQLHYLKNAKCIYYLNKGEIVKEGSFEEFKDMELMKNLILTQQKPVDEQPLQNKSLSQNSATFFSNQVPLIEKEMRSLGNVSAQVYSTYLKSGGNFFCRMLLYFSILLVFILGMANDYFLSFWVNTEQTYLLHLRESRSINNDSSTKNEFDNKISYSQYFTRTDFVITSASLIVALILVSIVSSYGFSIFSTRASRNLHELMFEAVSRATLRFFIVNNSGRIMNRFSKDVGVVDETLPVTLMDTLNFVFCVLGVLILVCVVNYWMIIPTFIVGCLFYSLRVIYLKTSTVFKRLYGTTKSPMYNHVNASIQGLTTIRASDAQSILIREFDQHADLNSSAWFTFVSSAVAFNYCLETVTLIYISLVTFSFLLFTNKESGSNVGLAISQVLMTIGIIQMGIKQSAEVENIMTAVERILEFSHVDQERDMKSPKDKKPQKSWPDKGRIEFKNVSLKYAEEEPIILQHINLEIKSQEKIGIVGRTGAGKSSLTIALFQLANVQGNIIIDDIDIATIGLFDLRNKISIIPQEPVLFSGTIRYNLDPFGEFTDSKLWNALDDVNLKKTVSSLQCGLETAVTEGGSNFSVGERQLFCLARAVLKNNKILIMDEATANIDPHTSRLIQKTIRSKFESCTVLTIAHRLDTVMDSDKIIVMDAGRVKEFGCPCKLIQSKGLFYSMIQQTDQSKNNLGKTNKETSGKFL